MKPTIWSNMKETIIAQSEFLALVLPIAKEEGQLFEKTANVFARIAKGGETILTLTTDGLETINKAGEGDYIVTSQTAAQEQYVIKPAKFEVRYALLKEGDDELNEYRALGKIIGIELTEKVLKSLKVQASFYFEAPWKEKMAAKKGDFLALPLDYSEVYRIARKEFFETYGPVKK